MWIATNRRRSVGAWNALARRSMCLTWVTFVLDGATLESVNLSFFMKAGRTEIDERWYGSLWKDWGIRPLFSSQLWTGFNQSDLNCASIYYKSLYQYTAECHQHIDGGFQDCWLLMADQNLQHWRQVIWKEQREVGQGQIAGVHLRNRSVYNITRLFVFNI